MTEGDLKQEIKEYLDKEYCCEFKKECKDGIRIRCAAYEAKLYLILRFAVPREKRIMQLEEQVEAMKCCENCKHYSASCCCNLPFDDCFELSAWELRK